jgi:hypothetical protein
MSWANPEANVAILEDFADMRPGMTLDELGTLLVELVGSNDLILTKELCETGNVGAEDWPVSVTRAIMKALDANLGGRALESVCTIVKERDTRFTTDQMRVFAVRGGFTVLAMADAKAAGRIDEATWDIWSGSTNVFAIISGLRARVLLRVPDPRAKHCLRIFKNADPVSHALVVMVAAHLGLEKGAAELAEYALVTPELGLDKRNYPIEVLEKLGVRAAPAAGVFAAAAKDVERTFEVRMRAIRALGRLGRAATSAIPTLEALAKVKGTTDDEKTLARQASFAVSAIKGAK